MGFTHTHNICDYRDFKSREICEVRDSNFCDGREYPLMSDPQYEFRVWMQQELAKRKHGAKGALASFVGVRADAITRMMNTDPEKETREIKAHELVRIREFFASDDPEAKETALQEALLAYGVSSKELVRLVAVIKTYVPAEVKSEQSHSHDQPQSANPRHASKPSRSISRQRAS